MLDDKPLYKHDCNACRFLGRYTYDAPLVEGTQEMTVDLYICPQNGRPTVLARASSEGPDYSSFPLSILWRQPVSKELSTYAPALFEAVRRRDLRPVLGRPRLAVAVRHLARLNAGGARDDRVRAPRRDDPRDRPAARRVAGVRHGALACAFRAAAEVALKNGITEKEFLRTAWACFRWEQDGALPDIVPPKSWPPDVPGFPEELFWTPPPDHDDSPEAVAVRLAAGEESDRRYDIRRNELLELEDEDFHPEREEGA